MATSYGFAGPRIVRDGLVLYLDAANPNSYNLSTPLTWRDISGNRNNGTLVNGTAVVSTTAGNVMSFDGVNDYIQTPNITLLNQFTVMFWMRTPTNSAVNRWRTLVWLSDNNNSLYIDNNRRSLYLENASPRSFTNSIVADANFHHVVLSRSATNTINVYVDNIKDSITSTRSGTLTFKGFGTSTGNIEFCDVFLYNLMLYNRELPQAEITQNYNATKGRFGL